MSDWILIVDDDPTIVGALAVLLERPGRTIVTCSDVESAELTLARQPITHLLTDVQFSGQFGYEGLHFVSRVRSIRPGCRVILMTGFATDALRTEAIAHGAAAVLSKPFTSKDLETALGATTLSAGEPSRLLEVQSIDQILRNGTLDMIFQPIVRLDVGETTYGFEALARVRNEWPAGGPAELFAYASRCSKIADLNLGASACAIREARQLTSDATLFLNVDPGALELPEFTEAFRRAAAAAGIGLDRIVIEITERSGFSDENRAGAVFDELRADGIRFALDDVGSAWSHLGLMSRIQPSFLKISSMFGTGSERDGAKRRIVRNVLSLARDFGCSTILEGIETRDTANAAVDLGIELGQGYFFGRPQPAPYWADAFARACA
jgi:EAL domain-containing protein (putative c-di-GMP-specific phosphodiesterase class I)/ActR/RegA family two-component response regulator